MKRASLSLRQRDEVSCGPAVAVVAGAVLDPACRIALAGPNLDTVTTGGRAWFAAEQARVHADVNWLWPPWLGTTPMGMARALSRYGAASGVRYRWRPFLGRRDRMADVVRAIESERPVAMLVGRFIPRHWVLLVDAVGDTLSCYEPSSGEIRTVELGAVRRSRLSGLGYPRPFAFVLPRSGASPRVVTRSATR